MISYIKKDTYGLSPEQKEYIKANAEEFGFDFIKYCDELSITISKDTQNPNKLDICVFVEPNSSNRSGIHVFAKKWSIFTAIPVLPGIGRWLCTVFYLRLGKV